MAVGKSGRVVIDIDPAFKRELRSALERDGMSMKDWFLQQARRYLERGGQTELAFRRSNIDRKEA
jgi:hypothetical protein